MSDKNPPTIKKKQRACLSCSAICPSMAFKQNGCPNCRVLAINASNDNFHDATSDTFNGLIILVKPSASWVGKWQRIENKQPGSYAMTVDGILPDEFVNKIEEYGNVYYERDRSFTTNQ